jgi:copper chaperone CopZ
MWGVSLHPARLLTSPEARVLDRREGRTTIAVDGLVCGVCAARTRRALAGIDGVRAVEVDLARGLAHIEHGRVPPEVEALRRALDGVVVANGWRRRLARLARLDRRHRRRRVA